MQPNSATQLKLIKKFHPLYKYLYLNISPILNKLSVFVTPRGDVRISHCIFYWPTLKHVLHGHLSILLLSLICQVSPHIIRCIFIGAIYLVLVGCQSSMKF